MTGDKKQSLLTVDDILFYTNGGKDVFLKYLGKISPTMKRPWGKDSKPSWGVFESNKVYYYKDLANEESGTAIQFVQKLFKLSFGEACEKIKWDFQLGGKESIVQRVGYNSDKQEKKLVHIAYDLQPFQKRHHEFWNCTSVSEEWCKKYNCYAVKNLVVDRKKVYISPKERVFVYEKSYGKGKVYFPDREGMNRFRNNLPWDFLWNVENIEKGKRVVVQKSMKDLIVTSLIYPNIVATQAEHLRIFIDKDNQRTPVVDRIEDISKDVWVFYGSDPDGVSKCQNITNSLGWKYINTPKEEDPDINDSYSYACKYGLDKLKEFCEQKQLIC